MQKAGNVSHAVMQQRHEALDSLDDFPTPPFATRAMIGEVLKPRFGDLSGLSVWEPCCNRGYMARPLAETFATVHATDIADYGWTGQQACIDFLTGAPPAAVAEHGVDWIISNTPFARADEFVHRALDLKPRCGVAFILRTAFLEGDERYRDLYSKHPPFIVAQHVERVPMKRGAYDPQAGTATSYSWFVWKPGHAGDFAGTWIRKCRGEYERRGDVNFEMRDGVDWVEKACNDTPLFAARD